MTDKLKPCPFCGGEAILEIFRGLKHPSYCIYCSKCGIETLPSKGKKGIINAWNRRANNDEG